MNKHCRESTNYHQLPKRVVGMHPKSGNYKCYHYTDPCKDNKSVFLCGYLVFYGLKTEK